MIVDKGSDFFSSVFFCLVLGIFFLHFSLLVVPLHMLCCLFFFVKAILFAKKSLTGFYDKHASEVRQLMGCVAFLKKVSIRQHTSAYVSIRQLLRQACTQSAPAYGLRSLSEKKNSLLIVSVR